MAEQPEGEMTYPHKEREVPVTIRCADGPQCWLATRWWSNDGRYCAKHGICWLNVGKLNAE